MARKESREGVKPLLYIAQPEFEEAKLNIQNSYVVKVNKVDQKRKKNEHVESTYEDVEEIEEIEDIEVLDENEEQDEETDVVTSEQNPEENGWVKKPFKAMTNEEKVQFMVNKPHYIPKVECRIRTKNDLYIGYIVAYHDGNVSIKIASNIHNIEIPIDEIVNIQMVGI